MLKIIAHGFLSGLGFLLAVTAVALALHNPFLVFIAVVLLVAFWHQRHAGDLKNGLAAVRASRGSGTTEAPPPPTELVGAKASRHAASTRNSP